MLKIVQNNTIFKSLIGMFTTKADKNNEASRTNCPAPLRELNRHKSNGDMLIYVSDNESWIDTPFNERFGGSGTETMKQWNEFKSRNADAKLVCIDIQPYANTQAQERTDILNVGGFSDQVFNLISEFDNGNLTAEHWVGVIEKVEI